MRRLQAGPNVDDGERAAMGITVPDRVPTPAGPPTTRPLVRVDSGRRLRHTLHFADEATPTRRAKPSGVMGAEIWVNVGEPPPDGPPAQVSVFRVQDLAISYEQSAFSQWWRAARAHESQVRV